MKTWIVGIGLIAVFLLTPTAVPAHEGHDHKVMGTISSIQGTNVMVKGTDGKEVMVMLNEKTKITQGNAKVERTALKVGDRVVAEGAESKGMITAATLKLGEAAKPAAKK
jgi:hypothetical protein